MFMRKLHEHHLVCEFCEKSFVKMLPCLTCNQRFCGRSCSNAWQHKEGIRRTYCKDKSFIEWWKVKFTDEEIAEKLREYGHKLSLLTKGVSWEMRDWDPDRLEERRRKVRMSWEEKVGKEHADYLKKRAHDRMAGKTLEERYGSKEKADHHKAMRAKCPASMLGKKHTASTIKKMKASMQIRLQREDPKMKGGRGVVGWYHGILFRSSYEYVFLKKLIEQKVDISDIVPEAFRIKYTDKNGKNRTYIPDYHVVSQKTVYEIKSKWALQRDDVKRKIQAAKNFFEKEGMKFVVLEEDDLGIMNNQLRKLKADAETDPDVIMGKGRTKC